MKEKSMVSNAVVRRLPRYYRYLEELMGKGVERISSGELSRQIGYTASQIRQDLNNFGGFGQQGYGYNVESLYQEIGGIIGLNHLHKMIIVGCGHMGHAIVNHEYFYRTGFKVVNLFDVKPELIGERINGIEILDYNNLEQYLEENHIDIGAICTNGSTAPEVAEKLCRGGVRGIWNFAPVDLDGNGSVTVENVHLSDSLYSLAYYIRNNANEAEKK